MAVPFFTTHGANSDTTAASVSVPYPAGIIAGDMLVLSAFKRNGGATVTAPGDWHKIRTTHGNGDLNLWVKRALGTESGNITLTTISGETTLARISILKNIPEVYTAATCYESVSGAATATPDWNAPTVVCSGPDRLAIVLAATTGESNSSDVVGESGGTWAVGTGFTLSTGTANNASMNLLTAEMASGGTISGGSVDNVNGNASMTIGCAFIGQLPAPRAQAVIIG